MDKDRECKKLRANWFRKGGAMLTALAVTALAVFVFYSIGNNGSEPLIDGIPNIIIYLATVLVALCGIAVFFWQFLSILFSKMLLSGAGIEIWRFPRRIHIRKDDVIRIDGVHERVMGAITQNRTVIKIITNAKTYEVNSHEYFGLSPAIRQWAQQNITK